MKTYTCNTCGTTKTESIAETGHSYSSTTKAATCTEDGVTTYKCNNCSYSYNETIPATEHNYVSEITKEVKCTVAGETTYTCSKCNDSYTEEITALGHDFKYIWRDDLENFHSASEILYTYSEAINADKEERASLEEYDFDEVLTWSGGPQL